MAIEVVERFESRRVTTGQNPTSELLYFVRGTNDNAEALTALIANSPGLFDPWGTGILFLPRENISIEPVGDLLWDGVVRYGTNEPQTDESVFQFDTGGGTQHITQSLETVGQYGPSGDPFPPPDFKGAIGVTPDSVEGVDIVVPVYQFSETHYLPDATVNEAYRATLYNLTGKVNDASFKGFQQGECLFLGASGAKRGAGDWEINFAFACSPNVTDLTIGTITGIAKKGWEYLWVRYRDAEDTTANALVKKPIAVYVERVYEYRDFSLLGI